jgi:Mycothiol maleylpyruvate isomerase N-terminal domain
VSSGDAMSDETMRWDEVADIGALLHELDDEAFDTPSLCDGWAVRDVLGHMGIGHTTPMPAMLARIGRYAFNVTKASFTESKTLFAGQNADEIRRFWDEVMVAQHPKRGISKLIPANPASSITWCTIRTSAARRVSPGRSLKPACTGRCSWSAPRPVRCSTPSGTCPG